MSSTIYMRLFLYKSFFSSYVLALNKLSYKKRTQKHWWNRLLFCHEKLTHFPIKLIKCQNNKGNISSMSILPGCDEADVRTTKMKIHLKSMKSRRRGLIRSLFIFILFNFDLHTSTNISIFIPFQGSVLYSTIEFTLGKKFSKTLNQNNNNIDFVLRWNCCWKH